VQIIYRIRIVSYRIALRCVGWERVARVTWLLAPDWVYHSRVLHWRQTVRCCLLTWVTLSLSLSRVQTV